MVNNIVKVMDGLAFIFLEPSSLDDGGISGLFSSGGPRANSQSLPKPMSIESVMPSNHLILWHPFLLQPSIFPSIRVFSNESSLQALPSFIFTTALSGKQVLVFYRQGDRRTEMLSNLPKVTEDLDSLTPESVLFLLCYIILWLWLAPSSIFWVAVSLSVI